MKLLIVDDNKEDLYMLKVLLEGHGYEVATAADGADALEAARRDPPDIIIADILMPVMDGFTLCRRLKGDDRLKEIPFVFYTATYTDLRDEELALRLGAERIIVKPVEPDRFVKILRGVISDVEKGKVSSRDPGLEEGEEVFNLYSERLVKKLEKKLLSLEREIAARRLAEKELMKHRDQLEELVKERTSVLEAFAYSMSHDLRAPLRSMQGFARALLEDYGDELDKTGKDYAFRIVNAAQRMDVFILDLLSYSSLSRSDLSLKPVSLDLAISRAMGQLETEIRESNARVTVEKTLPHVMAELSTLQFALTNLLTNAIKFVAPGIRPKIRVVAEERNERVRVRVEDNGIGIAPEHQECIFNVFERLHGIESYPGTGIGLALVKKGVEHMGGKVGLESVPGKGSMFWLELDKAEVNR